MRIARVPVVVACTIACLVPVVVACTIACLAPVEAHAAPRYRTYTVALDRSHQVVVSSSRGSVFFLGKSLGPTRLGTTELRYRLGVGSRKKRLATIYLTVRSLPTTSQVVFARLESPKHMTPVKVTFVGPGDSLTRKALGIKPDLTRNIHVGVDRTSGPYGWVSTSVGGVLDRSVFLSKAYRYRRLVKKYRVGTSSVKRLVSESSQVSTRKERGGKVSVSLGLIASRDVCERYFIVSPRAIVETDTPVSMIATLTTKEWRWLDPSGAYRKAPNCEPRSSQAFCRHLGVMRGQETTHAYKKNGSALFENLILNNLYSLALLRSPDGLWRTNYTSMWVKNESGIAAPYVDTRHNEAFALKSPPLADALNANGVTAADEIRTWAPHFANFLAARAARGNVIRTAHGYYFSDYYDASGRAKVHASLNHSLGEMCYLLQQTGDSSATPEFQMAMSIKAAIDDCGTAWIAPGHNTYYQRNLNGTYSGYESDDLSYGELQIAQGYFLRFLGQTDPVFDALIANKKAKRGITASPPDRSKAPLATGADAAQVPDSAEALP
jgi:hypothetical protein